MKTYIFVDLDETLIHTFDYYETPNKGAVEVAVGNETFKTSLRPGAHEFLAKLREIGEVRMLTVATYDYAVKMNETFTLGFADIWSRELIQGMWGFDAKPVVADKVYLFDNLPRRENRLKIEFLREVTTDKVPNYIQVKEYRGGQRFAFTKEEIDHLTKTLHGPDSIVKENPERALDNS